MIFNRDLDSKTIETLKKNDLFKNFLAQDCTDVLPLSENGSNEDQNVTLLDLISPEDISENKSHKSKTGNHVFPAIRENRIDFYYGGGRLFSFNGKEFETHEKYASVLYHKNAPNKYDYVQESQLNDNRLIESFSEGYTRIKENCAKYSGPEASGVSMLYGNYSWARYNKKSPVVVLDIEISFAAQDNKQDRIDLLLFDTESGILRFFEAKHYANKELRAKNEPNVISQINRYSSQLKNENNNILKTYQKYVDSANKLFNVNLPIPKKIDEKPKLLIFGFDAPQKECLKKNQTLKDLYGYIIGDIKGACLSTIYKESENKLF